MLHATITAAAIAHDDPATDTARSARLLRLPA
jgi:hypothetical protein